MKLNLPRRTRRRLPTRLRRSWESVPLLSGREDVAGMRHIGGARDPAVAYDLVRPSPGLE